MSLADPIVATRFTGSHVLNKRYCVTSVLQQGAAFQVLRVVDVADERLKTVKVVSRSLVDDVVIARNLAWLSRNRQHSSGHTSMLEDFYTSHDWFLVFDGPRKTLEDILRGDEFSKLPPRHVREIALQVIEAVLDLHRRGMFHLNVSPSSVEILDDRSVSHAVYKGRRRFKTRIRLACARVRLTFYGDAGLGTGELVGREQYRAPEIVLGWGAEFRSDNFSIGCLIWEMWKGRPMFPHCEDDGAYIKAKVHMYSSVLGEFPKDMVLRVRLMHDGIFKGRYSSELKGVDDLSKNIREFLQSAEILQDAANDDDMREVLTSLTRVSPASRPLLADVSSYAYFSRVHR